jgi:hypothetical protein
MTFTDVSLIDRLIHIRVSPSYAEVRSWRLYVGGPQAVILHLCLRTELSRALGVDAHVCELQLLTTGFYSVLQAAPSLLPLRFCLPSTLLDAPYRLSASICSPISESFLLPLRPLVLSLNPRSPTHHFFSHKRDGHERNNRDRERAKGA